MRITGITANNFCSKETFLKTVAEDVSKSTVDFTKSSYSVPTGVFPKEAMKKATPNYTPMLPIKMPDMESNMAKKAEKAEEIVENYVSESTII